MKIAVELALFEICICYYLFNVGQKREKWFGKNLKVENIILLLHIRFYI